MSPLDHDSHSVIVLVGLVIAALWICLPFAVFGVKRRLDAQTRVLIEIRQELERINDGDGK